MKSEQSKRAIMRINVLTVLRIIEHFPVILWVFHSFIVSCCFPFFPSVLLKVLFYVGSEKSYCICLSCFIHLRKSCSTEVLSFQLTQSRQLSESLTTLPSFLLYPQTNTILNNCIRKGFSCVHIYVMQSLTKRQISLAFLFTFLTLIT